LLVKALVNGFGGIETKPKDGEAIDIPPDVQKHLQKSAVQAIASKADPRWLPVQIGKDKGLPAAAPVFDIDEMRQRNIETLRKRVVGGAKQRV